MTNRKNNLNISDILLPAFIVSLLMSVGWLLKLFLPAQALFSFSDLEKAAEWRVPSVWIVFPVLVLAGAATIFLVRSYKTRQAAIYAAALVGGWLLINIFGARFADFALFFPPFFLTVLLCFGFAHLKRVWEIDRNFEQTLERTALMRYTLEGRSADERVASGLKLLQTVLPVEEVLIFQKDANGELNPIGRARDKKKLDKNDPQANWRGSVNLCEDALERGEIIISKREQSDKSAAKIALPLMHEERTVGAMFVSFKENFEEADRVLLSAFAEQMARNFHRQEVRELPNSGGQTGFLSVENMQRRFETLQLINGLLTEQQFGSFAFSEMNDGHAIAYLDGTLAYVNRPMLKVARVTVDRAKQLDLFDLLERFQGGVFDDPSIAVRRVMQTGEGYSRELHFPERQQTVGLQISLVRGNADLEAVHSTAYARKPLCLIVTVRDITAVKENEKLRSDMVSLMSHELRTPITSINGFAELLAADDKIPAEAREFLSIISSEAQRLSRMIDSFLSVSQLEQSDKREVVKIPVRLDTLSHEVLISIQSAARAKRIRLVEQANAHLPPVAADKDLIRKAIYNLVDNAVKYSPERTTIVVSTILEADAVRVIVEDRGYGIPADSIEKIWQKFYRVPRNGMDKQEDSTGLGLSLVKEIVEQHGGSVNVETEENQGSKFSFTLPRL